MCKGGISLPLMSFSIIGPTAYQVGPGISICLLIQDQLGIREHQQVSFPSSQQGMPGIGAGMVAGV